MRRVTESELKILSESFRDLLVIRFQGPQGNLIFYFRKPHDFEREVLTDPAGDHVTAATNCAIFDRAEARALWDSGLSAIVLPKLLAAA
jgi:hypothetical protein